MFVRYAYSARAEATKALSVGYDNIRAALLHIVQDPDQRADTQQEANGLHISLSYLDTVFMAAFWNIILERLNRVSMALQSAEIELGTAVKLLQSLQDFVSELRGNFDAIEMRAKQKDPSAKYKDAEKRIRKPKRNSVMNLTDWCFISMISCSFEYWINCHRP